MLKLIFFKINLFEKSIQEYHQSVKQFGSSLLCLIWVQTVCNNKIGVKVNHSKQMILEESKALFRHPYIACFLRSADCILFRCLLIFFKINVLEKFFQEIYQSVKEFGPFLSGLIWVQTVSQGYEQTTKSG